MRQQQLLLLVCLSACSSGAWASYGTSGASRPTDKAPGYVVHVVLEEELLPEYGPSFQALDVAVMPETISRLHVKISPSGVKRWEVPQSVIKRPGHDRRLFPSANIEDVHKMSNLLYSVQQPFDSPGNPFDLKVARTPTNQAVFDTSGHRFVFKDQYIELSTSVPEDADLFGLGEVTLPTGLRLPRDGRIITLYNRDIPSQITNANLYGSHPFLLQVNKDGSAHGVFFLNSNGMDVVLNKDSVTYKVIGGLVDLYFFMGPSPEAVIRQYHEVIGAPAMPPYWALGAQQGRWGYKDIAALREVVAGYRKAGIPLEALWLDIEYMSSRFKTLTLDETRFAPAAMREFVDQLHAEGLHWVPIHDAAIAKRSGYKAYEDGSRDDVWIKDARGETYVGQVWPGEAVYPDYLAAPKVGPWLKAQLQALYDQAPFDGLWLDMNEASNFCSGSNCRADTSDKAKMFWLEKETPTDYQITSLIRPRTSCQMECDPEPADNRLAHPPYKIHNFFWKDGQEVRDYPIYERVITPTAKHADGTREYDAHNLYGTTMAMRSNAAATEVMGKRPFFLLRSTFPGAGKWAGHWTGDNGANWESFKQSTSAILNSNMWGLAMTGADICGFLDAAPYTDKDMGDPPRNRLEDEQFHELCNRWTSAGAFYPFVRNHFTWDSRSHEPYRWPDVAQAARSAYGTRYALLTYLYSAMHLAHAHGGTLARPLFFADPTDATARGVGQQWMMGEALLVSPVMEAGARSVKAYFTDGSWYSMPDMSKVQGPGWKTLPAPLGHVPLHIRGGTIVPMQAPAAVTRDVRLAPITLVVALPGHVSGGGIDVSLGPLSPHSLDEGCSSAHARNIGSQIACGYLFMDAGDSTDLSRNNTLQVWLSAVTSAAGENGRLRSSVVANGGEAASKLVIDAVHLLGADKPPKALQQQQQQQGAPEGQARVLVNGKQHAHVAWDDQARVLKLSQLQLDASVPLDLQWGDALY